MAVDCNDREFFEQAVSGVLDRLYGTALRLAKNRADAEDLVAETVAKAWANRAALHDTACFRAWIFRILTNTFLSQCRKHGEASLEEMTASCGDPDEPAFSLFERLHQPFLLWWGTPEQEFLNKVLREHLTQALDALPETFRVVVILAELEGFSYPEIAKMLDIPIGTVRSRLARGRSCLQKTLWRVAQEAGLVGGRPPAQSTAETHPSPCDERHEQQQ